MDDKQYLESEVDMDRLYAALDNRENLPTTAIANPEEFAQHFTRLSQKAEAILHICQTPVLTALYKNALQTERDAPLSFNLTGSMLRNIQRR
jgi:fatty acid-binding protein DegV